MMANLEGFILTVWFNLSLIISLSFADSSYVAIGKRFHETRIWEVGVGLLKVFRNDYYTESPMFSIWNGTVQERWFLRLYPNGYLPEHKGQVSIYLVSQNEFETRPDIELVIFNQEPRNVIRKTSFTTYLEFRQSNGWPVFAKLSTLLDPSQGFIFDDKIKFGARFVTDAAPIREPADYETHAFYWAVGLKTMNLPNERSTDSPLFYSWSPSGQLIPWSCSIKPLGVNKTTVTGSEIKMSFYVNYYGDEIPYSTDVEMLIKSVKSENTIRLSARQTYTRYGDSWGLSDFIDRDIIINPDNGFVADDEIVFGLRIPKFNEHLAEPKKATITQTWDVGLELFNLKNPGDGYLSFDSPKYVVWNNKKKSGWFLRLFPHRHQNENTEFVSLYLVFDGNHTTRPLAKVFIVNEDPRNNYRKWSSAEYEEPNDSFGWNKFISKEYLLNPANGFVLGNKIKFGVQLMTDPLLLTSEPPTVVILWEIEVDYLQNGPIEFDSPTYSIKLGNITEMWRLRLWPQKEGFIELFLVSSNFVPSNPKAEVFISNQKPENTIRKWSFGMYEFFGQSRGWGRLIKFSDLIDEENGFVFENRTKFIRVGLRMQLEDEIAIETAADPDPVRVPPRPKVKLTPAQPESSSPLITTSTSTTTTTTTTPPPAETSPLIPYHIEAISSNFF